MPEFVRVFASPLRRVPAVILSCLLVLLGGAALGAEPMIAVTVEQSGDAFVIDALMDVQASLEIAWGVLTDFEHMTSILANLTLSRVTSRHESTWIVRQEGTSRRGPFSYAFASEREIHLEPMKRIQARSLSGAMRRMESETTIASAPRGVRIAYHVEAVPDSLLVRMFGASFARQEVEEQFRQMAREMMRRQAATEPPGGPATLNP